jgi:hypothetical protein
MVGGPLPGGAEVTDIRNSGISWVQFKFANESTAEMLTARERPAAMGRLPPLSLTYQAHPHLRQAAALRHASLASCLSWWLLDELDSIHKSGSGWASAVSGRSSLVVACLTFMASGIT